MNHNDSLAFVRTTKAIRKPAVRFRLASGRSVELLAIHLEPGYLVNGEAVFDQVAARLYPNDKPVWITSPIDCESDGFLCLAQFFSDAPTDNAAAANCSYLLVGGFVPSISDGIRSIASELLAAVEWEPAATNEFLW